jgi:hypothetical protein
MRCRLGLKSCAYDAKKSARMLTLIQRDDCALCDEAWEVMHTAGIRDFEPVYIDGDYLLESRFGSRVPVLRDAHGRELDWPFTPDMLRAWLAFSAPE